MIDNSDELLLVDWQNGDEKAFRLFYDLHFMNSIKNVYYKTGDFHLSEEIVQDAFLSFYNNKIKITKTPLLYLNSILKNKIVDHYRKKVQPIIYGEIKDIKNEFSKDSISENFNFQHLSSRLNKALDTLPTQTKNVFILSREEQLSHKEISDKLGISLKTVEYHITKAMKILKKGIDYNLLLFIYFINNIL
ncbi:sigma-70 family RNA polymerase sigma factor [Rhizosphaericola mali]|uniref:Sigma-70 family RNA polymerase sigma factor n=1 Tax=Rhizosphaericola mali TaxID=2545455 RepID=A0A5P2FZD7_9BACT|nr:sigma-70 family RNA polymerase sigma factor [Rhizosphaericola mali]QES88575.1 sigma-70 family RNA polymerase sigma factor [Rhizosphaericola mali]